MGKDRSSYVYIYFRPNMEPCYVGKGKKSRWLCHERYETNRRLWRAIQKNGGWLPKAKVKTGLTDEDAIELEKKLIKVIGRKDLGTGPLVNLTEGGEGCNKSPSTIEKMKKAQAGHPTSDEARAKMSAAKRADPNNVIFLADARKKRGPETPERAANRRAGQAKRRADDLEARKDVASKLRGKKRSPENIEKQRQAQMARSPEAEAERVEKIRQAACAQWARYRMQKAAASGGAGHAAAGGGAV